MPDEEYVDPEFPDLESPPEEFPPEPEGDSEPGELGEEYQGETPIPHDFEDLVDLGLVESSPGEISDELREQVDLELIGSSPDAQDVFPVPGLPLRGVPSVREAFAAMEYPPREAPTVLSPDSGGVLFLPNDDPIQQPMLSEPLDPRLVYTRPVPRRLRHLTCERRGSEYHKPAGRYRPGN